MPETEFGLRLHVSIELFCLLRYTCKREQRSNGQVLGRMGNLTRKPSLMNSARRRRRRRRRCCYDEVVAAVVATR